MKLIELSGVNGKGIFAIVDDEDWERLNVYSWFIAGSGIGSITRNIGKGKKCLAADIMNDTNNMYDHEDRNPYNNQKNNLRKCSISQNNANREKFKSKNLTSKYKGVCWSKVAKKWHGQLRVNKVRIHLGYFINEEDAARAYNVAATKYFGEFACLNILPLEASNVLGV